MKRNTPKRQSGYALILTVLALMGIGGVVLAGFTQSAKQELEAQRYQHNQRVLEQAKQALLMFAYNYPETNVNGIGPGRLPCPDVDNDGTVDGPGTCNQVGRFPWADDRLAIQETLDASGERLWYAVSDAFDNIAGGGIINSGTAGSITLVGQSGNILYDGAVAGLAAVIIAPGTILDRDEDANGTYEYTQLRNSDAQKVDPRNYLDTFGGFDNAVFTNGESNSNDDGFILGPVHDVVEGRVVVNDQLIIITADEVTAMAEMATLRAYRSAINDYLDDTGGVYPWLYNYDGVEYIVGTETVDVAIDKLSSYFPGGSCNDSSPYPPSLHNEADCVANGDTWDAGFAGELEDYIGRDTSGNDDGIFGRVPTTFGPYFSETESQPIDSRIVDGSLSFIDTLDTVTLTETFCEDGCPQGTGGDWTFASDTIDGGPLLQFETTQVLTNVRFEDVEPDVVGDHGRLSATFPADESVVVEMYFWDEDNSPTGVWTACPAGGDELLDCSRASDGTPTPGVANDLKARILHITLTLTFSGVEDFEFDYSSPPTISISPATAASHATITATYDGDRIISFPAEMTAVYEFEQHWHAGDAALNPNDNSYTRGIVDMSDFTLRELSLGLRYYPQIPAWAFSNEWHNAIRMAYALEYKPPGTGPCVVDSTCLHLEDSDGTPQNVASLLVIAGQHDWQDDDTPPNGRLKNDLLTVFDNGNENNNPTFYRHRGDDNLLVIEEL